MDREEEQATEVAATKPPGIRWIAVVFSIVYGFAKLNGSQFTVLDSEVTRPLGEVSGFWLTWYYFGYSTVYGSLVALVQIGGGVLLAWPRTALLGALLLLPVFANILLIDVFFAIGPDVTLVALLILGCLMAVIAPHVRRLQGVILLPSASPRSGVRLGALAAILVGAFTFTWWIANYNNRRPTPIDGVWSVVPGVGSAATGSDWRQVFFERNRAYWVTFRAADGAEARHHFEIDPQGVVRIWETWLRKGELIMQGTVASDGRLHLQSPGGVGAIVLQRQASKR